MNSSSLSYPDEYTSNCRKILKRKEIFISDIRTGNYHSKNSVHYVIVTSCVKCVKFQIVLNALGLETLPDVECTNVREEKTTFGDEDIFTGSLTNVFFEMNNASESNCEEEVCFFRKLPKKSCFTDSKLDYKLYCSVCQRNLREKFEKDLYVLSRVHKKN